METVTDILKLLDNSIETIEGRKALVEKILSENPWLYDNFENDKVKYILDIMATYILNAKENLQHNDAAEYPINTVSKRYKEESLEQIIENEDNDNGEKEFRSPNVYNKKNKKRLKDFINSIPVLKVLDSDIENLKKKLTKNEVKDRDSAVRLLKNLREDFSYLLRYYMSYYDFKREDFYTTKYDWHIFDFYDKNDVLSLIHYYSHLKEQTYFDLESDMRWLLDYFEYLVDNTRFRHYEKDVLIWKIDGLTNDKIAKKLQEKYGLNYGKRFISKILRIVATKITQTYDDIYEEWYYTFKVKGRYKTCSKCGKVYLATEKYFYKRNDSSDGLYNICKNCKKGVS